MNAKRLLLVLTALAIAGGLWLFQTAGRSHPQPAASETQPVMGGGAEIPDGQPTPAHMLRPPDHTRKFREMTPEQRVQLARQPEVGG